MLHDLLSGMGLNMELVGGWDEVCGSVVGEVWTDENTVVSCSTVFTGMHELARRFGAVLAFSEVPAWFLAWMNTGLSLSVADCVWGSEAELLLLLTVGARVVWGTKIKLSSRGSPLMELEKVG